MRKSKAHAASSWIVWILFGGIVTAGCQSAPETPPLAGDTNETEERVEKNHSAESSELVISLGPALEDGSSVEMRLDGVIVDKMQLETELRA